MKEEMEMLVYNPETNKIAETIGGYSDIGVPISDTFVALGNGMFSKMRCILYRPEKETDRKRAGIVIVHSDDDYSLFPIGAELAKRGYTTLCGQVARRDSLLDQKMENIGVCVDFLRELPGIDSVILLGHSGGATLMSAYQAAAETGPDHFSSENYLIEMNVKTQLRPADGLLLMDSNWGNGSMTLFSIDPAVAQEGNGVNLDPAFDIFNPEYGFRKGDSQYSKSFMSRYFEAQKERNNHLVQDALDRMTLIRQGKGNFRDDEPFIVAGGAQIKPCNKLIPEDAHLLAHTKGSYPLYHKEGRKTEEIVRCVRRADGFDSPATPRMDACLMVSVRDFLTNRAVFAADGYGIFEDEARGVLWEQTWNCTPGNVRFISAPMLILGMTGSYEYLAAEIIYKNAKSTDKEIGFIEGAGHNFFTEKNSTDPDSYGDTAETTFDLAAKWLDGRFAG